MKDKYDFILFDGSLLHHPINDLLQNYNASFDEITCHIQTLLKTVDKLNPQIVYLSSDNVAERLYKARISRKQTVPSSEQIRYWEERKQMDLAVMQELSIPCEVYDISDENWGEINFIANIKNE